MSRRHRAAGARRPAPYGRMGFMSSQRFRIAALALIVSGALCAPLTAGSATARAEEHTVSGVVLGDDNLPLPGASVTLVGAEDSIVTVPTGEDGRWATSVPDGWYAIRFSHQAGGYLAEQFDNHHERRVFSYSSDVEVKGQDVPFVDAQLVREGSIGGRILRDGAPVEGTKVQVEGLIAGEGVHSTRSGPDGRFILPNLLPGRFRLGYSLRVGDEVPALSSGLSSVDVGSGEDVDLGDLSLPDVSTHGTLELTAVGGDVSDIRIMSADDPVSTGLQLNGVSPGQPVTFANFRPGTYKISFGWTNWNWPPNNWIGGLSFFTAKSFVVKPGETTRASLSSSGELLDEAAYVRNTRFQPLANITVLLRRADRPDEVVASAQTEVSGLFRFDALPQADYLLTMIDPAGRYATKTVPLDPDALGVLLQRRQAPQLEPIDESASNATLREVGARGARPVRELTLYQADDGGGRQESNSFVVDGQRETTVRPGTYKVRLGAAHWYGGRSFSSAMPVTLAPGTITDLNVGGLPTNGDLVGTAKGVDGVLLKDAAATVYAADNPTEVIALEPVQGEFKVKDLPLRSYKIRIDDPTGRYDSAWVGGGDSFASAPSFIPEISEETKVGVATLPRRTGPAPWEVPSATPPVAGPPRPPTPPRFAALERPRIKGTPKVGRTLKGTTPMFNRHPAKYVRTWFRDGRRIGGATRTTYRLKKKDAGHRITFRLQARAADGQGVVMASQPTRRVSRR